MAASSKALFRATKAKPHRDERQAFIVTGAEQRKPEGARRALDLYPTGQPDAIRALFAKDGERIRSLRTVWEPAAGRGDLVREIEAEGLVCYPSDIADHGCPGVTVRSFYHFAGSPGRAIITNPPYCEINARDGHGRWLRHTLSLCCWDYCALLLSWDWPAARANGLGELLDAHPFTRCYLMRWKLDFTGEGSPPQRNAWFVWDRDDVRNTTDRHPDFCWLDRIDGRQGSLFA